MTGFFHILKKAALKDSKSIDNNNSNENNNDNNNKINENNNDNSSDKLK